MRIKDSIIVDLIILGAIFGIILGINMISKNLNKDSEHIGIVNLNIQNIDIAKEFYTDALLLDIISENDTSVSLGKNNKILLILNEANGLPPSKREDAGLYHFALVYESRSELANIVKNVIINYPEFYAGSADHKVSQAFYFADTEGNGIELYVDKPQEEWVWINKTVQMDTTGLNPQEFYNKYYDGTTGKIRVGHVHLKVGDLKRAEKFYVDILGFDITSNRDGALFVSKGGYHHNIGLNIWSSEGSGIRGETLGLNYYEIILKSSPNKIIKSLDKENIEYKIVDKKIYLKDPWGTNIILIEE